MFGASSNPSSSATPSSGLFGGFKPQGSGNLFGSTSAPSAGLFGASSTSSAPQSGGKLFGATVTASTPQAGGSLFGSTANSTGASQTAGSLFGSSTANNTTPQTGGSLFGSTAPTSSTPSTLFGHSNQTVPAQTTSTSLFGNSNQNSSTAGNLFNAGINNSAASNPQGASNTTAPQTGATLFGSTAPASSTLFGNSSQTAPAQTTSTSLFGNSNQNASTGNLFGSANASANTGASNPQGASNQTGGSLFGSTAPASTTTSTLFGSSNQTAPAQTASTSLFGNSNQNSSTANAQANTAASNAQGTPSLFGSTSNNAAPQTGGSLFGSAAPTTSTPSTVFGNSNSTAPTSTSLFGNLNKNSSTGNLFGSTTTGNNNPATSTPQITTSLFGSTSNNAAPQTGGSLFGSAAPTTSTPSTVFGNSNSTAPTSTSLFGNLNKNSSTGNLFGSTNQSNPVNLGSSFGNKSSGVPVTPAASGLSNNQTFTRTTRFNDLPDDVKKQLEMLDAMIQTQCRHSDNLKAMKLGTEITEGTSLLRQVTSEMHATSASVTNSSNLLDSIRQAIDTDVSDLLKLAAIVEAHVTQRLAHNPTEPLPNPIKFQYEFFSQKCAEMEDRVKRYRQTIEFVELQLKGLFDRPSPASIVPALKAQYSTFMALADKVAQLNTSLISLKEEYREIWRHQTGSVRDPFAEVDRFFGIGNTANTSLTGFQPC